MEKCICQEILDSIKECLWLKQPSTLPETEQRWRPAGAPRPDPPTEFIAANCATYEQFTAMKYSCEGTLALVRDTHEWVLAAAVLLEEKLKG